MGGRGGVADVDRVADVVEAIGARRKRRLDHRAGLPGVLRRRAVASAIDGGDEGVDVGLETGDGLADGGVDRNERRLDLGGGGRALGSTIELNATPTRPDSC